MTGPNHRSTIASPRGAAPEAATRVYAVGDIHGRSDLLSDLVERIDNDLMRRPAQHSVEIYLGDYIDRGPDSKGVVDILCKRMVFRNAICLRGNHEQILEAFLQDPDVLHDWLRLGAAQTLQSYAVRWSSGHNTSRLLRSALPQTHRLFLECLRNWFICGNYLFVHAGLRPGVTLNQQSVDDLLWIRNEFLVSEQDHGYIVVHGHTPVSLPDIRHNRINIDTGAIWSDQLTCIVLEGSSISFL